MQVNYRQLIGKIVSPQRLISDFDIKINIEDGQILFGQKQSTTGFVRGFTIRGNSFVQTENADITRPNEFIAGDVIDFLAWKFGWDYDKAITTIFDKYGSILQKYTIHDKNVIMPIISTQAKKAHDVIKLIFSLMKNVGEIDPTVYRNHLSFLNRKHIRTETLGNSLICFNKKDPNLDLLLEFLSPNDSNLRENTKIKDVELYDTICIPFFNGFNQVSHLWFMDIKSDKTFKVDVCPSKVAFCNLFSCDLDTMIHSYKCPFFCTNIFDSLSITSERLFKMEFTPVFGVQMNDNAEADPFIDTAWFERNIFLTRENSSIQDTHTFFSVLKLRQGSRIQLYDDRLIIHKLSISWDEFIYVALEGLLKQIDTDKQGMAFKRLVSIIQSLKAYSDAAYDPSLFLKNCMATLGKYKDDRFAKLLDSNITFKEYKVKGGTMCLSDKGYIYKPASKNLGETLVTNFIINIDSQTIFPDNTEILLSGRMRIHNTDIPINLIKSKITTNTYIEAEANVAYKAALQNPIYNLEGESMPIVFDPQLSYIIAECINKSCGECSVKEGVSEYGWNFTFNNCLSFITPTWKIDALNNLCKNRTYSLNAGNKYTFYYANSTYTPLDTLLTLEDKNGYNKTFQKVEDVRDKAVRSGDLSRFLSVYKYLLPLEYAQIFKGIMGMLFCKYLDLDTMPMIFNSSDATTNFFNKVCGLFGQIAPYNFDIKRNTANKDLIIPPSYQHLMSFVYSDGKKIELAKEVLQGINALIVDNNSIDENNVDVVFQYNDCKIALACNFFICSMMCFFKHANNRIIKHNIKDSIKNVPIEELKSKTSRQLLQYYTDIANKCIAPLIPLNSNKEFFEKIDIKDTFKENTDKVKEWVNIVLSDEGKAEIEKHSNYVTSDLLRIKFASVKKEVRDAVIGLSYYTVAHYCKTMDKKVKYIDISTGMLQGIQRNI